MLKPNEIFKILRDDLENKKSFNANWHTECDLCGVDMDEGDMFYFMGNKEKVCETCFDDIVGYIENEIQD